MKPKFHKLPFLAAALIGTTVQYASSQVTGLRQHQVIPLAVGAGEVVGFSPNQNTLAVTDDSIGGVRLLRHDGQHAWSGDEDEPGTVAEFDVFQQPGTGNLLVQAQGGNVTLSLPVQKSTTLGGWETFETIETTFPKIEDKEFYRLILPQ